MKSNLDKKLIGSLSLGDVIHFAIAVITFAAISWIYFYPNDVNGDVLQHLHLLIGERTGGSHDDRLTRVDAQRVEVFHRGNGEAVVVGIADALELNLLPAFQTLFNKNLRGESESTFSQFNECLLIGTDT